MRRIPTLIVLLPALMAVAAVAEELTVEQVVSRHIEARGGAERWSEVETLRMRGSYSAFSFRDEFTLIRSRGDLYRLDFTLLDSPATRARDGAGVWGLHKLLQPQAIHITEGPYPPQMERESLFLSPLFDYTARGISIELSGRGDIDGIETINLAVKLSDGWEETWMLDAETYLEVAVDSQVWDFTQAGEPVLQRTYFEDFREVDGLVFPHQIEMDFNHRLEGMTVREVEVNPEIPPAAFSPPPPPEEDGEADEADSD